MMRVGVVVVVMNVGHVTVVVSMVLCSVHWGAHHDCGVLEY